MADKMSLIKESLETSSNSLREYSRLTGKSAPDSMSELSLYSKRYPTLRLCDGGDTYVGTAKIDYIESLISATTILQGGYNNSQYFTITGFTNDPGGDRDPVSIINYRTIWNNCYDATHNTVTGVRGANNVDEGALCYASLSEPVIIDFGSTFLTTTTLTSADTRLPMPADYYKGASNQTYTVFYVRYWNGSAFEGAASAC